MLPGPGAQRGARLQHGREHGLRGPRLPPGHAAYRTATFACSIATLAAGAVAAIASALAAAAAVDLLQLVHGPTQLCQRRRLRRHADLGSNFY